MAKKKTKTIEVKVLQRHIDKGNQEKTNTCAIALALAEQFNLDMREVRNNQDMWGGDDDEMDYVSVDGDTIKVRKTNGFSFNFEWSKIPSKVGTFVRKFDEDKTKVKPFSFRLPFFTT